MERETGEPTGALADPPWQPMRIGVLRQCDKFICAESVFHRWLNKSFGVFRGYLAGVAATGRSVSTSILVRIAHTSSRYRFAVSGPFGCFSGTLKWDLL